MERTIYLPWSYIVETGRRRARAAVLWRRGGEDREKIIRMRRLGRYLRSAREELGLTRTEIGERVGLDPHHLLLIEGGLIPLEEIEPVIDRLARGLGKTVLELRGALDAKEEDGPFD